jgi:DNA-binding transcriptional ArsR family regulator
MKAKFITYSGDSLSNYTVESKTFEGREYFVVPVVMMREGVHSGSRGPLFHSIDELGKYVASWNGIPVMISHPKKDGNFVSANSPEVLEESKVGFVFNSHVDEGDDRLRAEAWLEKARLKSISPKAFKKINKKEPMEVSVGVFSDEIEEEGEYNGEAYTAIAINHRPDHLALLPDEIGACSLEDGCGVRTNSKSKKGGNNVKDFKEAIKLVNEKGFNINEFTLHKDGYCEIVESVRLKLNSMDDSTKYHYLEELYDDAVVYAVSFSEGGRKLYRQEYQIVDDQVSLMGEPVEVIKKVNVTFEANTIKRTKFNTNKKSDSMSKPCAQCVKVKVDALISNTLTVFEESDREYLETLSEDKLDKLIPKETPAPAPAAPAVNSTPAPAPVSTPAPAIQALSAEDRAALDFGRRQLAARRLAFIGTIQANTSKELWPDATLNAMSDDLLERIAGSFKKEEPEVNQGGNYFFNGFNPQTTIQDNSAIEGLYPEGVE